MQKLISLFLCLMVCSLACMADDKLPEYALEGAGTGAQGSYLIKISLISKDKKPDDSKLLRAAVHGVLFKGFNNKELRQHQKPLAGSPAVEAQHPDYFNSFFADGGAYTNYADVVSGSRQVMKTGKKYRVTVTVTVYKDQLRKDLESAGVLKGLNSIF